jgi:hypothetical protein
MAKAGNTSTVIVVVEVQLEVVGVKVYVVVAVLFISGNQVPVTPFVEVVGKVKLCPLQIGATCVNAGTTEGFT